MFKFEKNDLDTEIKTELEKVRRLSQEELEQVNGGKVPLYGDTREEYSMDPEDISRSIYGALYDWILMRKIAHHDKWKQSFHSKGAAKKQPLYF